MKTLDFTLPNELRIVWRNENIKEIWNYRVSKIASMINKLQYLSVKEGVRTAGREMYKYKEFVDKANKSYKDDILFLPLRNVTVSDDYSLSIKLNNATGINCLYLNRKNLPKNFNLRNTSNDNKKMGELLGYPKCCREFFVEEWENRNHRDMIWQAAMNTESAKKKDNKVIIKNSPKTNTILKPLGVRSVFHMPHSFDCEETKTVHEDLMNVALKYGYKKEVNWLKKLLSMKMKWSSLHGIAIVTTPIFKIRMVTDAVAEELIVEHEGHDDFIFFEENLWEDNGFNTYKIMEVYHSTLEELLSYKESFESFVDMGCGNGYLLSKIDANKKLGIDFGSEKVERGNDLFDLELKEADIFNYELEFNPEVIHISANRIYEAKRQGKLDHLKKQLFKADLLYITHYGDGFENQEEMIEFLKNEGIIITKTISVEDSIACKAEIA